MKHYPEITLNGKVLGKCCCGGVFIIKWKSKITSRVACALCDKEAVNEVNSFDIDGRYVNVDRVLRERPDVSS